MQAGRRTYSVWMETVEADGTIFPESMWSSSDLTTLVRRCSTILGKWSMNHWYLARYSQ